MTTKVQGFQTIKLSEVEPWPYLNPRMSFDQAALQELAESIRADGLLQPIAVAPVPKLLKGCKMLPSKGVRYWVFAGERRLRAIQLNIAKATVKPRDKFAESVTIDAIVHDVDEATAHRLAGIENLERNDLTAIEEAIWIAREIELTGLTHKGLGETLGRSQAWVANRIRLLDLPKPIQTMIHTGTIAPAMARDTLLRFTKLWKADQSKLWKAIAKKIKAAAKDDSPVLREALEEAAAAAVRAIGAVQIQAGFQREHTSPYRSYSITSGRFDAFKKEHADRCVQVKICGWRGDVIYTFAATEWKALVDEAVEEQRATRSTGGVSKKKLEKPKLGPTKEPVDLMKLKEQYGLDNVVPFDQIVDPTKIDPASVVHVKTRSYESSDGKEGTKLMYVGPNVRALKGARTRVANPLRAGVATKVQSARMDKGADLKVGELLVGLLGLIINTDYSDTLHGMIEAELGREVEWSRYEFNTKKLQALKVPAKSVRRIAAGLARIALSDDRLRWYDLNGDIKKAVEARVTKDRAKARKKDKKKVKPLTDEEMVTLMQESYPDSADSPNCLRAMGHRRIYN
ncbi:hypothetical protein LCGC14_2057290, partial [marine sediment metagenome]